MDWADRAFFAALIRQPPRALRGHRLVTPEPSCAGTAVWVPELCTRPVTCCFVYIRCRA